MEIRSSRNLVIKIKHTGQLTQQAPHDMPINARPMTSIVTLIAVIRRHHPRMNGTRTRSIVPRLPKKLIINPVNTQTEAAPRLSIDPKNENSTSDT